MAIYKSAACTILLFGIYGSMYNEFYFIYFHFWEFAIKWKRKHIVSVVATCCIFIRMLLSDKKLDCIIQIKNSEVLNEYKAVGLQKK